MAFRLMRSLNIYHTTQLLNRGVSRKNIFLFKLFQSARLLPFINRRLINTSLPLQQSDQDHEVEDEEEEMVTLEEAAIEELPTVGDTCVELKKAINKCIFYRMSFFYRMASLICLCSFWCLFIRATVPVLTSVK